MRSRAFLPGLYLALLLVEALLLMHVLTPQPDGSFLLTPFAPFGFLGTFLFFVGLSPSRRQMAFVAALASLLAALRYFGPGYQGLFVHFVLFIAFGFAANVGMLLCWLRPPGRPGAAAYAFTLLSLQIFLLLQPLFIRALGVAFPPTYDFDLLVFEHALGVNLSAAFGMFALAHAPVFVLMTLVYEALPLAAILLTLKDALHPGKSRFNLLLAFLITAGFGLLYCLFPACGPRQVFGALFPAHVPADFASYTQQLPAAFARNAMPSLHSAWAVLLFVFALDFGGVTLIATALFTLITLYATMASGEHYFIDLVLSAPVVSAVLALCLRRLPARLRLIGAGAGAAQIALWFTLLWQPGLWAGMGAFAAWGACLVTVALNAALVARLRSAAAAARDVVKG